MKYGETTLHGSADDFSISLLRGCKDWKTVYHQLRPTSELDLSDFLNALTSIPHLRHFVLNSPFIQSTIQLISTSTSNFCAEGLHSVARFLLFAFCNKMLLIIHKGAASQRSVKFEDASVTHMELKIFSTLSQRLGDRLGRLYLPFPISSKRSSI